MTDQELQDAVRDYILALKECDDGECLHEMSILDDLDDDAFDAIDKAYALYRAAQISVTFG